MSVVQVLSPAAAPPVGLLGPGSAGTARAIVWPGVGAQARTMHLVTLPPGAGTLELTHPGEAVYYVVSGGGTVRDAGSETELREGSMVHVEPGTAYAFAAGGEGIAIVGGPGPADPALYEEG